MNQTPILHHTNSVATALAPNIPYLIPQVCGDIINAKLASSTAQMRIMYVLVGSEEGTNLTEQWMLARTGLTHSRYIEARNKLKKRGWIIHEKGKITVDYDAILKEKD